MRFMMLIIPKGYESQQPGFLPDTKNMEAMMEYNVSLGKAGVLLDLNGLQPPSVGGARITFKGGKAKVTDGPFAEAKEALGGYWMLQVKSKAEAVEWASRCPAAETDTLELRQVFEMSDFGADAHEVVEKFPETRAAGALKTLKSEA